ncbi:hypothetical protein G7K_1234-t1 [Saitoella complicata NRRL Y-17804]|uniref:Uncharacterized protein n=1 Tax=Saitoella complicata (strain BCRC 22490 / CBS 7301 / JCM 7358 / NBRC 10748 / NRRL Y-17804) TaxID=698492 RepID=A0A0E9NC86_SAICN|nr:hypothetical protein G7K_1234-t1 [Saitoella complicata NRRL Y-17804]
MFTKVPTFPLFHLTKFFPRTKPLTYLMTFMDHLKHPFHPARAAEEAEMREDDRLEAEHMAREREEKARRQSAGSNTSSGTPSNHQEQMLHGMKMSHDAHMTRPDVPI